LVEPGLRDEFELFVSQMSLRESANDWKVINKSGHMGLFQFSKATLKRLGYNITPERFRKNPAIFPAEIQYQAFCELLELNEIDLQPCFKYIGSTIAGIEVTKSGLLAGTHLGGLEAVKLFLITGGRIDREDCNGTKISDYVREFGRYKI
jgi:hypothetical protein